MPEVFRCEIHLKLKFGDIVEEEEDNVEARDDASHVAEKIEQFVVAALIDDTFIERFEDHIGGGICWGWGDIGEDVTNWKTWDCVFDTEGEDTCISSSIGRLQLVVVLVCGFRWNTENFSIETIGEKRTTVAKIYIWVGHVELNLATGGRWAASGGAGEVEFDIFVQCAEGVGTS